MITMDWDLLFKSKPRAIAGETAIQGDEWDSASPIIAGDEWDKANFGTDLRYERYDDVIPSLPVKVEITGRKVHVDSMTRKIRIKITTWDMAELPVSFPGWLYLWNNYTGE